MAGSANFIRDGGAYTSDVGVTVIGTLVALRRYENIVFLQVNDRSGGGCGMVGV